MDKSMWLIFWPTLYVLISIENTHVFRVAESIGWMLNNATFDRDGQNQGGNETGSSFNLGS